jgi:hypothetical protein
METQQGHHHATLESMETHGYAILHGSEEPPEKLRKFILTETTKLRREEIDGSPLYYVQPVWNTPLWAKTEAYVKSGINVRFFECEYVEPLINR